MSSKSLLIVMDPIQQIKPYKDSSFAMLLEAQARGWQLYYCQIKHLFIDQGESFAQATLLNVEDNNEHWWQFADTQAIKLNDMNLILMRKDPPFNQGDLYATYMFDQPQRDGALVLNHPNALRNANEKLAITQFPELCANTLVSCDMNIIQTFIDEQGDAIAKPLDGMGGSAIFRTSADDPNKRVIIETLTQSGQCQIMVQRYIPEISSGDKRILVIDGEPFPYALARIPAKGEHRGNLAAGGRGEGIALSKRDYEIVETVAPWLKASGILFAGLDVIGDYLTEINITSPTCIRELDTLYNANIAGQLFDVIEKKLAV